MHTANAMSPTVTTRLMTIMSVVLTLALDKPTLGADGVCVLIKVVHSMLLDIGEITEKSGARYREVLMQYVPDRISDHLSFRLAVRVEPQL
jgi:hypothetical protein